MPSEMLPTDVILTPWAPPDLPQALRGPSYETALYGSMPVMLIRDDPTPYLHVVALSSTTDQGFLPVWKMGQTLIKLSVPFDRQTSLVERANAALTLGLSARTQHRWHMLQKMAVLRTLDTLKEDQGLWLHKNRVEVRGRRDSVKDKHYALLARAPQASHDMIDLWMHSILTIRRSYERIFSWTHLLPAYETLWPITITAPSTVHDVIALIAEVQAFMQEEGLKGHIGPLKVS